MADSIKGEIDDKDVKDLLGKVARKTENRLPLMQKIAGIMHHAVERNFEEEGRPKWKQSISAKKRGGKTLQDSGQLAVSINERATNDEAAVGTNKVHAAAQQFGVDKTVSIRQHTRAVKSRDLHKITKKGTKGRKLASGIGVTKAHSRRMKLPARPFLSLTDGDNQKIKDAAVDYFATSE